MIEQLKLHVEWRHQDAPESVVLDTMMFHRRLLACIEDFHCPRWWLSILTHGFRWNALSVCSYPCSCRWAHGHLFSNWEHIVCTQFWTACLMRLCCSKLLTILGRSIVHLSLNIDFPTRCQFWTLGLSFYGSVMLVATPCIYITRGSSLWSLHCDCVAEYTSLLNIWFVHDLSVDALVKAGRAEPPALTRG